MDIKIVKYNPGGKFHLSFGKQLHYRSYFDLAREPYERQSDPSVISHHLDIDSKKATEFIVQSQGIRKFYANLKPQEWNEGQESEKMLAIVTGDYSKISKVTYDHEIVARDPFLTNLHFMSDLGLLSKQAAAKLTRRLDNIANLEQWPILELNKVNLNDIPQIGPIYALEMFRVLIAWGATPSVTLPLDAEKAEELVRAGLKISSFDDKQICELFRRSASPEVTGSARTALRRVGVGNPAISIALDVLAV